MSCGIQNSIDNMHVAAPCSAEWAKMNGDERVRHCTLCRKNVYNLSAMTRAEAEALIKEKEGKLCVRFYRRADGTVLTENCPAGLRAIRRRLVWLAGGIAALFVFWIGVIRPQVRSNGFRSLPGISQVQNVKPISTLIDMIDPPASPTRIIMGEMAPVKMPTPPAVKN